MVKVSVIIPIYNVENYIERCAHSLFQQTLEDIEFIFINDCTPDNSIVKLEKVLTKYPYRKNNTQIIHFPVNKGQAAVRKHGMMLAKGKYIIHCDADDWVEHTLYEKLYNEAEKKKVDVVVCDFYNEYLDHTNIYHYPGDTNTLHEITRTDRTQWWVLWNRLINAELIHKYEIYPIEGQNFLEDVCVMMRIYYYANGISYINEPLYHYNRQNQNSTMNHTYSTKMIKQQKANIDFLASFFNTTSLDFSDTYNLYKETIRNRFLCQIPPNWNEWATTYPEIGNKILNDKRFPLIYRFLYFVASKGFIIPFKFYHSLSRKKR
ncbi:MAG: glycosyltransferase [Bacteroidaceae bacterium]|nr:glycosyltransferase [Bacteroidaceae bacterium]